jgi:hypothetical protein
MDTANSKVDWWCEVSIRICHACLDPTAVSELLDSTPHIAQHPGETRIPHGNCRSAGYWCLEHRVGAPDRPSVSILWAEEFVKSRETQFGQLLENGFDVNVYIGVFSNVLALGFDMPPTPTIWKMGIPLGIEFFSK